MRTARALTAIAALALAGALTGCASRPAEGWFPRGGAVYADVTRDRPTLYCHRDDGHASHLGVRAPVYRDGRHTWRAVAVHNSCVEEADDYETRDVRGFGYEYRLW